MDEQKTFDSWAVLELMGHRKLAGRVSETTIAGGTFLRIDVPGEGDQTAATQFYRPEAVYCLTPCSETLARAFAAQHQPAPVTRWELPAASPRGREDFSLDGYGEEPSEPLPFEE